VRNASRFCEQLKRLKRSHGELSKACKAQRRTTRYVIECALGKDRSWAVYLGNDVVVWSVAASLGISGG
jgi:hypothetical protein